MSEEHDHEFLDDEDFDEETFEDLPTTEIDVKLHLHFGMSGSFPLHISDIFLCHNGVYIVEYGSITPLFGLTIGKHRREAEVMQAVYDYHGIDEVLLQGDIITWYNYSSVDHIDIHSGGRFGRVKITIYLQDSVSYSCRLHTDTPPQSISSNIKSVATQHGFGFQMKSGMGFRIKENMSRFLYR